MERATGAVVDDKFGDGDEYGYDAVVVGSGYGGSVAACRMSMVGIEVCLIEKGRRWEAKDFPTDSIQIMSAVRMENKNLGFTFGSKDALFQVYEQDDSLAATACGLGGGSLVNAGVMVPTPVSVRRNPKWPKEWEKNWDVCEASASAMLRPQNVPVEFPNAKVMGQIAEEEIEQSSHSSINLSINFESKEASPNSMGSQQMGNCLACGNCLSGCPYNAKSSTDKNYLASAVQAGCMIKTECQVQYVVRNPDDGSNGKLRRRWRVYFNDIEYVTSDFVVISAGVFGTAEILFKSERRGLTVSERLGFGFSCNGNNVAYLGGSSAPLNAYGLNKNQFSKIPFQDRPGPSISSSYTSSLGFTIQSAVLPTSFPYLLFKGISTYPTPNNLWFLHWIIDKLKHMLGGKASQEMVLNIMGHDESDGRITLEEYTNKICFSPPQDPLLPRKVQALQRVAKRLGGILFMSKYRSTSVHHLGGCNAASDPLHGVCNANGQVFNRQYPLTVHPGLYVCDASLIPCSIGINPCFTIAIVAEHVSRHLVQDVLRYKNTTQLAQLPVAQLLINIDQQYKFFMEKHVAPKMEMRISRKLDSEPRQTIMVREMMRGYIGGMPCTAYLTMQMNSRDQKGLDEINLTKGEPHPLLRGRVGGYVVFKALEKEKLYIIEGNVDMCKVNPRTPYTQYMNYHLVLASASGLRYILEGEKTMNPYLLVLYAWRESTTLNVTLRKVGEKRIAEEMCLKGQLHLSFTGLWRTLIGIKGNNKGTFIILFIQALLKTYITQIPRGIHVDFSPADLIQKAYPLNTLYEMKTEDGFKISCRQWKCTQTPWRNEGEKQQNPVLLINGHSTESYWLPTEPKDLIRMLLENGYDTWLLQARLHPSRPSNEFTIDDIGKFDIPAVIKKIREVHGLSVKVHVIAHCVGGLAIHIALMGGYIAATQIASLCCTNSSMFFQLTTSSLVKMRLPLIPISMGILGKERTLPMLQNSKASARHRLLKTIARLIPRHERCTCDECEVFSGIFGNTFWHANVSSTMHYWLNKQSLQRLPMSAFPHLRKICTSGFIVDSNGQNTYLVHPERMALHTLYISGGRTLVVTPQTSFLANQYMRLHQPDYRHTRVVVEGFGHSDLLIGEDSHRLVFPHIISHIRTAEQGSNGVLGIKGSKFSKEALSWGHDPYEAEDCSSGQSCSHSLIVWFCMLMSLLMFISALI